MLTPNVVPDFTGLRVAVAGDLIADQYVYGRPTRLSREAPVMVLRHAGEEIGAGGAANVAMNLWSLGAPTFCLGAVGRDACGRELIRILDEEQVDVGGVRTVAEWVTPLKTRILGAEPGRTMHHVLRIDREPDAPVTERVRASVADGLRSLVGRVDAILLSDYGYGLVGDELAAAAREAHAAGAIVVLDPRRNFEPFRGLTAFTPNLAELADATGHRIQDLETQRDVTRAAHAMIERYEPEMLLVTMGNRGMALYTHEYREGLTLRAAGTRSVIDVSGAGDTAAATFTLALAAGLEGARAMRLANTAAGVVVMEQGATSCPLSKLRSELPHAPQPVAPEATVRG